MKKFMIFFCMIVLLLTGCSTGESTDGNAPKIEEYSWLMTAVQSMEADGQIIAHSLDTVGVPDTSVMVVLKCSATNEELTLIDETNGNTYTGTYKITDTKQETRIYDVTIGDIEGVAVVSMTNYQDESQIPTLIISLEDYSINFFSVKNEI